MSELVLTEEEIAIILKRREVRARAAAAPLTRKQFAKANNYLPTEQARNLYWDADISISNWDLGLLARLKEIPGIFYRGQWFFKPEDIRADIAQLKAEGFDRRRIRRIKGEWKVVRETFKDDDEQPS